MATARTAPDQSLSRQPSLCFATAGLPLISIVLGAVFYVLFPAKVNAAYPATAESTATLAVRATLEGRWDDFSLIVDTEALADFSSSFIRCSDNPSGRAFRRGFFGEASGAGVPDRQFFARIMQAVWDRKSRPELEMLWSTTQFRVLGSIVEGDTTYVVYRISNPLVPRRPFPTILTTRRTPRGYAVIPGVTAEDAIIDLGLECGSE
jgi:hypothetical protein